MALPLLSTVHVNANCSDLARSLAFYRDLVGLAPLSHTKPVPQDGRGFGLAGRVQWDAHLLHDERGVAGPAVDLLEWQEPRPIGRPASAPNQLGLYRLCLAHPDLDALYARLRAAGVRTASAPAEMTLDPASGLARALFCAFDPDGTCVEFIEQPGAVRLLHVNVNCRDLDRSSRFYQEVLGLAPLMARSQPGAVDGRGLGFPGTCRFRADFLAIPGRTDLIIDLLEWLDPAPDRQARGAGEPARLVPARLSGRGRARVLRGARPARRRALGPVLARHGTRDPDRRPLRRLLPRPRRHLPRADRAPEVAS